MRVLAIVLSAMALALGAGRQESRQEPRFRAGVELVSAEVRVLDAMGRPVTGLRLDDFQVAVDGNPRTIAALDYVPYEVVGDTKTATAAAAPGPVPLFTSNRSLPQPARSFVIVIDEENIRAGESMSATRALARFVQELPANDRVGLVSIPHRSAIDPTTDRRVLVEALARVVGRQVPAVADAGAYHLGQGEAFSLLHDRSVWEAVVGRECGAFKDPARVKACGIEMEGYARGIIADNRQRRQNATAALSSLFQSLAGIDGPKVVLLVSQQLPVAPFAAERAEFNADAMRLAGDAARARVTLYAVQLDLSPVDVERRTPLSRDDVQMAAFGLETLTSAVGGTRVLSVGEPDQALRRISLETSGYYLLGFLPEATDRDGKLHKIKVTVRRKGVDVRAREYFAFAATAQPTAKTAIETVNRLLRTDDANDLTISVATYVLDELAVGGRDATTAAAGKVRVLITAEVDQAASEDRSLAVGYTLVDAQGKAAGAYVEQVTLERARDDSTAPLCYLGAAVVPRGSYALRFAAATPALRGGSVVHRFDARLTDAGPVTLSDLIVLERFAGSGKTRPSVTATVIDEILCYVEAYAKPDSPPTSDLTARLEIADAADKPARASEELSLQGGGSSGRSRFGGAADLRALPPGGYVARVVFRSGGKLLATVVRPVRLAAPAEPSS